MCSVMSYQRLRWIAGPFQSNVDESPCPTSKLRPESDSRNRATGGEPPPRLWNWATRRQPDSVAVPDGT